MGDFCLVLVGEVLVAADLAGRGLGVLVLGFGTDLTGGRGLGADLTGAGLDLVAGLEAGRDLVAAGLGLAGGAGG